MKLVIATPFYEIKAYSPYIVSLMNSIRVLEEMGIEYDYYELSGDSYVDRAKNSLVNKFLESDATHLFMIDSDLAWDIEGFGRILKASMAGIEVVGGAYPNKNNWNTYGCILVEDENGYPVGIERDGLRLLEAWGIPGGFLIYSREAFEKARPGLNSYTDYTIDKTFLECFRCNVEKDGSRVGEDIYFQKRYREQGGRVFLEPNIHFMHYGVKGWGGNYHEYLLTNKKLEVSECLT